jgi:undecaprenyl-diphosphatase
VNLAHALLYGVIQGLSEFLPVSSSGHLALLPYLMAFKDPGVAFDLCMHVGTAGAVLLYFRAEVGGILSGMLPRADPRQRAFFLNFAAATVVSVLCILLLRPFAGAARSPWLIAFNQAFFGLVLLWADRVQRRRDPRPDGFFHEGPRWRDAAIIGAAQALAIFPGVSRSGITLSAGFFLGLGRVSASAFSFLLSLPIIAAGVLVEIPALSREVHSGGLRGDVLLVGVVSAFVVGLATIHIFLRLIRGIGLGWFSAYRIGLALVLVYFLTR